MHLTDTAYGDIADFLLGLIRVKVEEASASCEKATGKRLESVVTRSVADPVQRPVVGRLPPSSFSLICTQSENPPTFL